MFAAEDLIKIDNEYFFAAKEINAICKFDETERCIEIVYSDSVDDIWAFRRYARVFRYADLLIFAPMWASKILFYRIDKKTFESMEVKKIDGYNLDRFFAGQVVGDKLVLAGCLYPSIAVIDLRDFKIEYYDEPFKEMLTLQKQVDDCFFRNDMVSVGNFLYLASCISNKVLEFNVQNGNYKWHTVGKEENRYSGIAWDGEKMWLSPRRDTNIVCWNPTSYETKEIPNPTEYLSEDHKTRCSFLGAVYDGNSIILPGMQIDRTLIINPKTFEITLVPESFSFFSHRDGLNYALNTRGVLKIYTPGIYNNPTKIIETINDKELMASLIHDTGEIIHEGYKDIQLKNFISMVSI